MTSQASQEETKLHGGRLVARRLKAHGVTKLFTLSGGHLFSIYDGCRSEGIELIDTRHELTAAFAAEGWAKVTRTPGVAALTAGPGVTNGMSALGSAQQNNSPVVVLGGRAPEMRWGQGSLQEIDHVPFVAPLVKSARTAMATGEIAGLVDEAFGLAMTPPFGPTFVDFPLDVVFMEGDSVPASGAVVPDAGALPGADGALVERAAALLSGASRPVVMAGTGLYWGHGEDALLWLVSELRIPVFLNGLARGCVPADHELFFSRARSVALRDADVALVIGVPMDFRLGFGGAFGEGTRLVWADAAAPVREHPREVSETLVGGLPATLSELVAGAGGFASGAGSGGAGSAGSVSRAREEWISRLRSVETEKRAAEREQLEDQRVPLHPLAVYHGLKQVLDRNAVIVGDGGDFVSYAGRVIDSFEPGCWLDPGPFGCLGSGPGYALAAKLAHPDRQVVLLLGDGAFGFSGMEFDTLARHGVNVVAVMGNNGIWALEHHPMKFLYGYSVVAELRPETRYDQVVEALGCHGELVRTVPELVPALSRAFDAGVPALVNVLTDPEVAYPRSSNLA